MSSIMQFTFIGLWIFLKIKSSWKLVNHFDSSPIHTWWVKQAMALLCQLILAGIYNPWCFATTYSKGATTTSNETAKRQQECANITVASCKTHHTHSQKCGLLLLMQPGQAIASARCGTACAHHSARHTVRCCALRYATAAAGLAH